MADKTKKSKPKNTKSTPNRKKGAKLTAKRKSDKSPTGFGTNWGPYKPDKSKGGVPKSGPYKRDNPKASQKKKKK